jgi:hypothetical protein
MGCGFAALRAQVLTEGFYGNTKGRLNVGNLQASIMQTA